MKKAGKRIFSVLLVLCMLAASVSAFAYGETKKFESAKPQNGDVVIADFGGADAADEIVKWQVHDNRKKATGNDKWLASDLSDEVYRSGKTQSLKWDNMGDAGTANVFNTRLMSPSSYEINNVINNNYLYAWIYSDNATTTAVNILVQNNNTGMYYGAYNDSKVILNWQGWKLVQVDLSGITKISDFDKNDKTASETDKFYVNLQTSGWNTDALRDPKTTLYVDSIWLSNTNWYADDNVDYVIADFSNGSAGLDLTKSNQWLGKAKSFNYRWSNNDYSDKQTRVGKASALKWSEMYVEPQGSDGTYTANNTYIQSPVLADITLGDLLKCDYINAWIYSDVATPQMIQFNITDKGIDGSGAGTNNGGNVYNKIGEINWTGWRLVSVSIAGLTKDNFSRTSAGHTATDDDKIVLSLRAASNGIKGLSTESLLYVDSFWLSKSNPIAAPSNTDNANLGFSIENNADGVEVTENIISITTDNGVRFATENVGGYKTAFTVKKNNAAVPASDYYVQAEGDRCYIVFNSTLDMNAEYAISWGELTMNDSRKANAGSLRFRTAGAADYVFSMNNRVASSVSESTGKLTARVPLSNSSAAERIVKMLIAVYDANKKLVSASIGAEYSIPTGGRVNVTASADDVTLSDGMFARAYVWSMDNQIPFAAFGELK